MKRTKILTLAAVAAVLGGSLHSAQDAGDPRFDPDTAVTLKGAVVSLSTEPGVPSTLVVDDAEMGKTVVRLGPSWYLNGLGFTAAAGETVSVSAFTCADCNAAYVASRLENLTTGAIAELRDDDGFPVWRGKGKQVADRPGRGWRRGAGCQNGGGHRGGGGGGHHGCGQCRCGRG